MCFNLWIVKKTYLGISYYNIHNYIDMASHLKKLVLWLIKLFWNSIIYTIWYLLSIIVINCFSSSPQNFHHYSQKLLPYYPPLLVLFPEFEGPEEFEKFGVIYNYSSIYITHTNNNKINLFNCIIIILNVL